VDAAVLEREYLRFLELCTLVQAKTPSKMVDAVWHAHILDSEKYMADCAQQFGSYLNHTPFYEESWDFHESTFATTLNLYETVFGEKADDLVWAERGECGPPTVYLQSRTHKVLGWKLIESSEHGIDHTLRNFPYSEVEYQLGGPVDLLRVSSMSLESTYCFNLRKLSLQLGGTWGKGRSKAQNAHLSTLPAEMMAIYYPNLEDLLIRNANLEYSSGIRDFADMALQKLAIISCAGLCDVHGSIPVNIGISTLAFTLKELTLADVDLYHFPDISMFENLELLSLERNYLTCLPVAIGPPVLTLRKLNLSKNNLELLPAWALLLEAQGCKISLTGNPFERRYVDELATIETEMPSDEMVPSLKYMSARVLVECVDYSEHPDVEIIDELITVALGKMRWYSLCFWCGSPGVLEKQQLAVVSGKPYATTSCEACQERGGPRELEQEKKSGWQKIGETMRRKRAEKKGSAVGVTKKVALQRAAEMVELARETGRKIEGKVEKTIPEAESDPISPEGTGRKLDFGRAEQGIPIVEAFPNAPEETAIKLGPGRVQSEKVTPVVLHGLVWLPKEAARKPERRAESEKTIPVAELDPISREEFGQSVIAKFSIICPSGLVLELSEGKERMLGRKVELGMEYTKCSRDQAFLKMQDQQLWLKVVGRRPARVRGEVVSFKDPAVRLDEGEFTLLDDKFSFYVSRQLQ
jgi:hypothetical protein